MEESWDADNFEPKFTPTLPASKWEGEDEEEDVKESWEDDEEEKKDEEKKEVAPAPAKSKKKLVDKIAEKERAAKAEMARRAAEAAEAEALTPEQRAIDKLRRQKLQEESDLRLAMETFGVVDGAGKIDSFNPSTQEEFVEFADLLAKKINLYRSREEFPAFVEDLFRNITVQMTSLDIKRVKTTVDNIYIEKQKVEKNEKAKKATKGKGKAKLRVEGDNAHLSQYDAYGNYDQDYDDFI